jgi:hypothetical protein
MVPYRRNEHCRGVLECAHEAPFRNRCIRHSSSGQCARRLAGGSGRVTTCTRGSTASRSYGRLEQRSACKPHPIRH